MNSKIVRDNIPSIIKQSGQKALIHFANHEEKIKFLKLKLVEEAQEAEKTYSKKNLIEELADMLQVMKSLCEELNIDFIKIEEKRIQKAKRRGEFKKAYILKEIKD